MCYDVHTKLEQQLNRAKHKGDEDWIAELLEKLKPYREDQPFWHVSGFTHPKLVVYTNLEPYKPILATWGLVPSWVKSKEQRLKLWNSTLIARGETMFEKPSFKESALTKRCIIPIQGFYEHHHKKGGTIPYFIRRYDKRTMNFAGLWNEWLDTETGEVLSSCSIITTKANPMMAKIHNNPKIPEPRMPVILADGMEDKWLAPLEDQLDRKYLEELIQPYPEEELEAYTVRKLKGNDAVGNTPEACEEYEYVDSEPELF